MQSLFLLPLNFKKNWTTHFKKSHRFCHNFKWKSNNTKKKIEFLQKKMIFFNKKSEKYSISKKRTNNSNSNFYLLHRQVKIKVLFRPSSPTSRIRSTSPRTASSRRAIPTRSARFFPALLRLRRSSSKRSGCSALVDRIFLRFAASPTSRWRKSM